MDRILVRSTKDGESIVFLADSIEGDNQILAWKPGLSPYDSTLDFYHTTTPSSEDKTKELTQVYEKTWDKPAQVMHRLPRVFREKPKLTARDGDKIVSDFVKSLYPTKTDYVAVAAGKFWKVEDESGKAVAYCTSEEKVLVLLEKLTN